MLAALVLGACEVNSHGGPPVRDGGGHSDLLGRRSSFGGSRGGECGDHLKHLGRTSTRHPVRIVHSTAGSAGRRARVAMRTPTRIASTMSTGRRSRESAQSPSGARPAAALDLSEDDLDRVAERWLPRQKKAGLAAGVTGMEGINYVTAPRGAPCHAPATALLTQFPIIYRLVE